MLPANTASATPRSPLGVARHPRRVHRRGRAAYAPREPAPGHRLVGRRRNRHRVGRIHRAQRCGRERNERLPYCALARLRGRRSPADRRAPCLRRPDEADPPARRAADGHRKSVPESTPPAKVVAPSSPPGEGKDRGDAPTEHPDPDRLADTETRPGGEATSKPPSRLEHGLGVPGVRRTSPMTRSGPSRARS